MRQKHRDHVLSLALVVLTGSIAFGVISFVEHHYRHFVSASGITHCNPAH